MADTETTALPPGWELKYDKRTGKHYYMNYLTKMTSWEDPRSRNKNQQGTPQHYPVDFVAQQSGHGSPYHVYPYPSPMPLQHAFSHSSYPPSNSFSPKALPKQITELGGRSYGSPLSGGSPILGHATPKGSPHTGRMTYTNNKFQDTTISFTNDVDTAVAKISSMFPTVSETHIKILLKKYYNREAVVISALQVEKHPISTPGPFSTPPAGASRLQTAAAGVFAGIQLAKGASPTPPYGSSPRGSPPLRPQSGASTGSPLSAPMPHSSPKMKLRYMKSMFPKAEETLILDVLANEDNNVQKASDKLLGMGYAKKDINAKQSAHAKQAAENSVKNSPPPAATPPRLKSTQEKQSLKERLQKKYSSIPERVVAIALESVGWSEERAEQILSVVLQEDVASKKAKETIELKVEEKKEEETDTSPRERVVGALPSLSPTRVAQQLNGDESQPREINSLLTEKANRRCKNKKEPAKSKVIGSPEREKHHQSHYLTLAKGPNPGYAKGAQDSLLLVDYITWNGANPELKSGSKGQVKGSMRSKMEVNSSAMSRGPNKDLCKGPSVMPSGSIYQHINSNNIPQMKVGGE